MASVGTIVRDHMYDASMAKETASARAQIKSAPLLKGKTWNKHNADAQRGNQGRHGNLLRAVENGLNSLFAIARLRLMFSISTVASSHQNADRQSQTAQRHDIDRFHPAR